MPKLSEHPFVPLNNPDFPTDSEVFYNKYGSRLWFKGQVMLLGKQTGAKVVLLSDMFGKCTELVMSFIHVEGQKIDLQYLSYSVDVLVAQRCFPDAKFPMKDPDPIYTRIFRGYMKEETKLRDALTVNKNTKLVIDQELGSQTTSAGDTTDSSMVSPFHEEYVMINKDQCIIKEQSNPTKTFMETLGEDLDEDTNAEEKTDG
ncbi:hypothetical protein EYC80_003407 [Monilinia laxa]|uniref:Uncharacterized protein n=1 Tax=Monilinia laxa TaxID=61186 RepID=A0A5N6KDL4_MONLA|nr:hypothetical protein EYC80_003407 [Monilinia laxa]